MDPLALLREAAVGGTLAQVTDAGGRIAFGDRFSFPKDAPTTYRSLKGTDAPYPLSALLFFARNRGLPGGQYMQAARAAGIIPINFRDRKDAEAYLTGAVDRLDAIQQAPPELLLPEEGLQHEQRGALEPAVKRARLDPSVAAVPGGEPDQAEAGPSNQEAFLAEMLGRERRLRDRNTQLLAPRKSFRTVINILDAAQKKALDRERQRAEHVSFAPKEHSKSHRKSEALPLLPSRRFERPTAEGLRAMGIDEFAEQKIDAYGARKALNGDAPPQPPVPEDANGKPMPPPPPVPGEHRRSSTSSKHRPPASSSRHNSSSAASQHKASSSSIPIIIVPEAATASINMLNVKAFLEDGVYKTPQQAAAEGAKKREIISIQRSIGRTDPVTYYVTDKPPPKKEDWRRVVAVFVSGQAWQFNKWPHKGAAEGDLALALSLVHGVYVGLKGEVMPDTVKKWNVHRVEVPKDNRHRDRPIVQEIYAALDAFLASRQCKLAY